MCDFDNSPLGFGVSAHIVDRLVTLAWIAIAACGAIGLYVAYRLIVA